jgi:nitroimidazol reductase NimA-like FMN-containing flavoprotein (pyridoxamine 5'-phosphate oxidase superfamily)
VTQSFTPDLKRLLLAAGCRFVRSGKGDHEIWQSPITQVDFVVDSKSSLVTLPMQCSSRQVYQSTFDFAAAKVRDMTRENIHLETHLTERGQMQGLILRFRGPGIREAVQA